MNAIRSAALLGLSTLLLSTGCMPPLPSKDERHSEDVGDADFAERVEASTGLVFVSFWASWCPPCRRQAPIYEELAAAHGGRARFYKLNVDAEPETTRDYGIESIPVLMLFRDGDFAEMLTGAPAPADYRAWIEQRIPPSGLAK